MAASPLLLWQEEYITDLLSRYPETVECQAPGARYGGGAQVRTLGLDQRRGGPNINIKNLGSTQVQPRFNPGSTQVQPRFNPGSTQGSTQVQPRFEPRFEPRFNRFKSRFETQVRTQVQPRFNPG